MISLHIFTEKYVVCIKMRCILTECPKYDIYYEKERQKKKFNYQCNFKTFVCYLKAKFKKKCII